MSEPLIRFVVTERHPDSGRLDGLFRSAYRLRRSNLMSLVDHDELAILLGWFDDNLPVPKRFNRTKSKGWSRRNTKGISWFKVSANEYVSKAQRIKSILNNYGIEVREVRSFRPGFITHEDSIQVVAEPFAATAGVS